jgi:hypothetical protein
MTMHRTKSAAVAVILTLGLGEAFAQDLQAIETAEAALVEVWNATPLQYRRAVFVSEPPRGFGVFAERADAIFRQGEPIVVYAEPVGYGWRDNGDGTYSFGLNVDLLLKTADGTTIVEQADFQRVELTSRVRNREFMLTLTLEIGGAPPGDYVVEYRTRDIASDKAGTISLPFSIR